MRFEVNKSEGNYVLIVNEEDVFCGELNQVIKKIEAYLKIRFLQVYKENKK